jgi:lysozyme
VPVSQNEWDALVSFHYNTGGLPKSTLLQKLNSGDRKGAAAEFHRWNKGGGKVLPGLTRRRASESLLFQGIKDANYDGKADPRPPVEPMPQAVDPPED